MGPVGLEPGKYYLFACPWDWTFVGRYVRHANRDEIVIDNAGYFTRTGATFDVLSEKGFASDTKFHARKDGAEMIIPAQGPKWPWTAPVTWGKEARGDD